MNSFYFFTKRILLIFIFCCSYLLCKAQTYFQDTVFSGTIAVGCENLTTTPNGDAQFYPGFYCGVGSYWIGDGFGGSFTYTFSSPIKLVRVTLGAFDSGEVVQFFINGSHYPLSSSNLSNYPGTCSTAFLPVSITSGGDLVEASATPYPYNGGGQVDISYPSGIDSIEIFENGSGLNGTVYSFFFVPRYISQQPVSRTICDGDNTSISIAGYPGLSGYQWQQNAGSGFVNITNGGVYSGATSNTLILTNPGTSMSGYLFRCTTSGTCSDTSDAVTLTVKPLPVLTSPDSATTCSGQLFTYTPTSSLSSTLFTWARASVVNISPSGNSGVGNVSEVLTNATSSPINVTYVYTLTTNGCSNYYYIPVTVDPAPSVNSVTSQAVCNGANTSGVSFSGSAVSGTTYNWTNNTTSIGLAASGSGNIASFTATNSGSSPVTATITVTPIANGCSGTAITFTITVNPTPSVNTIANQAVCNGASMGVTFSGPVSGTTYSWTNTSTAIGLGSSGSGNIATFTATNSGNSPISAAVTVTPSANGCSGAGQTFTITVNPTPTVNTISSQTLCNGANTSAVSFSGSAVSGTTYDWTNNTTSVGLAASGIGNIASFTAVNTGSSPVTATVTVTPSANGCNGMPASFTITVNPSPVDTLSPAGNDTLCTGSSLTLSGGSGASYQWLKGGAPISGATASTYTASLAGVYTLQVTGSNGCTAISPAATISFLPRDTAAIGCISPVVCYGDSAHLYSYDYGGSPGLQWINNGSPITGATGINYISPVSGTIQLIVSNGNYCHDTTNSISVTILPQISANISAGPADTVCNGSTDTLYAYPRGGGYTYVWQVQVGSAFLDMASSPVTYSEDDSNLVFNAYTANYRVIVENALYPSCQSISDTTHVVELSTAYDCACASLGGNGFSIISGATFPANGFISGHRYYILNDVTLTGSGASTAKNAYITVNTGKTIYIDTTVTMTFDSSHIFSACGTDMWRGLVLNTGVSHSARLYLQNQTLIEDADTAVIIDHPFTTPVFTCSNTVFNKNSVGVAIQHDLSPNTNGHYYIASTVFTSRYGLAGNYNAWVFPSLLTSPLTTSNGYTPPYYIDSAYASVTCNSGQNAQYGVLLDSVGYTTFDVMLSAYAYNEVLLGDNTSGSYRNLFDQEKQGIRSINSNLSCVNNSFMECGDGIYAMGQGDNHLLPDPINFTARLRVWDSGGTHHNRFYDCTKGVEGFYMHEVIGQHTYMVGNHSTTSALDSSYGYSLSSVDWERVDLRNDTIFNVTNGIVVRQIAEVGESYMPATHIDSNEIRATLEGEVYDPATSTRYVSNGIQALCSIGSFHGYCNCNFGYIHIDSNRVMDTYRGVLSTGHLAQKTTTNANNLVLASDGLISHTQYGVWHAHCLEDSICNNENAHGIAILGNGYEDSTRGYYASYSNPVISCNYEDSVGRGFEFAGACSGTAWVNNNMQSDLKGFVVNQNGVMGTQGDTTDPIGNNWNGTWTPTTDYWTFPMNSSNPLNSILWVNNTISPTTTYPQFPYNGNIGIASASNQYSHSFGSIFTTSNTPSSSCGPRLPHPDYLIPAHEAVATNVTDYGGNPAVSEWIGQYKLWQTLLIDTALLNSSTTLQAFYSMAESSRYAYLTTIENYISVGNFSSACSMLATCPTPNPQYDHATGAIVTDSAGATHVVNNYRKFYRILIHYLNGTISGDEKDSLISLAGLCPATDGTVVYQARGLYAMVFNDVSMFTDEGCNPPDYGKPGRVSTSPAQQNAQLPLPNLSVQEQAYVLSPNPNNGSFALLQKVPDANPVNVEIWNAEGKILSAKMLQFNGGITHLNVQDVTPGLYLLKLQDSKGKIFIVKFVVNP